MGQNFPILDSAYSGSTIVEGSLNSTPDSEFTLEFFYSGECDPSGAGEGHVLIGTTQVTTNGSGDADFSATFLITVPIGNSVTATATNEDGNTSEFSPCVLMSAPPVTPTPTPEPVGGMVTVNVDSTGDGDSDWLAILALGAAFLGALAAGLGISLRQRI